MSDFVVKDSGARQEFASGMVRDTTAGKVDYSRALDGPMFDRWAAHLTRAETKYPDVAPGVPNWTLARGSEEYQRFRKSALRHFLQWFRYEVDEDHASAVFFNINGAEYVRARGFAGLPEASQPFAGLPESQQPRGGGELAEIPHGEGFGVVRTAGKMGER